jgi:peptidoglycan/xylan/chitin deacetylase (PgdA/CDA1 family)
MNGWKMHAGDRLAGAFSILEPLRSSRGCRVLMYHSVGSGAVDDSRRLYSIMPSLFAEHVRAIAERFKGQTVSLDVGVKFGKGLVITFDDGYRDNLTLASPLLIERGIPFTVFVTPDLAAAASHEQFLSQGDLRQLAAQPGVTIGAHGRSHRPLTACTDQELDSELRGSRSWLEDLLGRSVTSMSYPYGAMDARVRRAVAAAGYSIAACSRIGRYRVGDDPLQVPRTEIWAGDSTKRLLSKAAGDWDWMRWVKP